MYAEVGKDQERPHSGLGAGEGAERGEAQPGGLAEKFVAARDAAGAVRVFYNDPGVINTRYERIAAITAADVQRVARQYLVPENRTVVITMPKAPAPGAPGAGAPGAGR
jgi:hypothetical protein